MPAIRAAALALLAFSAPALAQPQAGQTPAEFEASVTALLATQGDKMGYALTKCALRPGFAQTAGTTSETYIGRPISNDEKMTVLLAAVVDGKVTRWQEFPLPKFEGWITHHTTSCTGDRLTLRAGGTAQRYRWNGKAFARIGR